VTPARPGRIRSALIIVAAWTFSAALTAPAAVLVDRMMPEPASAGSIVVHVLLGAVAWMAGTPVILRIGRRCALAGPHLVRNLAILAASCLALTPLIVFLGFGLSGAVLPWLMGDEVRPLAALARGALITSLFNLPSYVAVAAIGQALAYLDRHRQRERVLARAELQALRAQIQPHFLFNALAAIATLGYREPALADAALTRLAGLLRTSLHDSGHESGHEVALRDEIAFTGEYLELHRLLMADRLAVRFDIDAEAWTAAVPSMLLQPLVENAVVHGIARRPDGGQIAVTGRVAAGRLILAIENDAALGAPGAGGEGVGLANLRERLRVLYGDAYQLRIDAGAPGSVTVTIEIPARRASGQARAA
jgi:two-component system sensor histidine kinase AlgZ